MLETNRGVVHPALCDIIGHLTTRHYTAMFDDASYHLVHASGLSITEETGFVDVQLTLNFVSELRAGALFYIRSGYTKIGNSSFTALHQMFNCDDDSLVATEESVSVFFDMKARKAIPLSDDFKKKAATLMLDETT